MIILALAGNRNTTGGFNNRGTNANLWSSSQSGATAWNRNLNTSNATVNRNPNSKANGFSLRCLKDSFFYLMASSLIEDLFQAYYDARRHKRNTNNALRFEMNFEAELFQLRDEILNRTYEISKSTCFISFYPVKREIFAGHFRDRIIHHLLFNYLNPLCERLFIYDSYSCREGRGTSLGVKRAEHFIRSCSNNYQQKCFILKLDIAGYFMTIDKHILFGKIRNIIGRFRSETSFDENRVLWLLEKVVFHDPTQHCIMKGKREDWVGLPKSKSLFFSEKDRGLPIGNLTSQLFGNIYLNDLDHFVGHTLKCRYYGRYVDDMLFVHTSKEFLKAVIPLVELYLENQLTLTLHPKKIYLQQVERGVTFLGRVLKPYRVYLQNRAKGNMWKKLFLLKIVFDGKERSKREVCRLVACLNSYMGMLDHGATYKLGLALRGRSEVWFSRYVGIVDNGMGRWKVVPKEWISFAP
ncbi:MAG: reverse transcriptase domain-containing protein [Candidatus Moraniibacteriota bacterium]